MAHGIIESYHQRELSREAAKNQAKSKFRQLAYYETEYFGIIGSGVYIDTVELEYQMALMKQLGAISIAIAGIWGVTTEIDNIVDMNSQISAATEQQHVVVEMISVNINRINDSFNLSLNDATKIAQASVQLESLSQELDVILSHFKV